MVCRTEAKSTLAKNGKKDEGDWREKIIKIKWRNKYWVWCKCKFAKVVKIRFLDQIWLKVHIAWGECFKPNGVAITYKDKL